MVGQHIEISNRFIHDYVAVFQIAKQCKTRSCHKSPFIKGGFRGECKCEPFESDPRNENRRNIAVSPVVVAGGGLEPPTSGL